MTRHELHQQLWQFLYDNPECTKGEWEKWDQLKNSDPIAVENFCFACSDALERALRAGVFEYDREAICQHCPIDWEITITCQDDNAYYQKWLQASFFQDKKTTSEFAQIIRDLKWKE